jgi:hypothetical protein
MLEQDYLRAVEKASSAAGQYLAGVRRGEERRLLVSLAMDARDRWATVSTICALGEDAALTRLGEQPWRHQRPVCHADWLEVRNWAVRAEDAGARCQMAAALMTAHRGECLDEAAAPRSLQAVDGNAGRSRAEGDT